jgi:class 3 adenylate cyclase
MKFLDLFRVQHEKILPNKFSGEGTALIAQITRINRLTAQMLAPEEMVGFLRKHTDTQNSIIAKHGGIVQAFVGDAILAYWVRANADTEYVNRAFLAAEELLSAVSDNVDYRVSLGTGELAGVFFEPINQFQVVGTAMSEADQLSRFEHPAHRTILLAESTKSRITRCNPTYRTLGVLPNQSQVLAAF